LFASKNSVVHQCTEIGSDQLGNKGVVCIDLSTGLDPYDEPEVVPQVEVICENPSDAVVQCAEAHANMVFATDDGVDAESHGDCGHTFGACSTGRNYWVFDPHTYDSMTVDSPCSGQGALSIWAVIYGQNGPVYNTSIELPGSGKWVHLTDARANDSGSESTGHYYFCY
jgi:hypothetical protein